MEKLVRPEGLEPPALWFEARCSIQLSYRRTVPPLYSPRPATALVTINRMSAANPNNHEREVKISITSPALSRAAILAAGFTESTPRHLESNTVFDTPDQSIRARGELLRLRTAGPRSILTFKGPTLASARHKLREELEVDLGSASTFAQILSKLGLQPLFVYEKYRTEFAAPNQPGIIMLDETPIGPFLELEGAEDWIDATASLLGFTSAHYITASYGQLYRDECSKRGIDPANMVFPQ